MKLGWLWPGLLATSMFVPGMTPVSAAGKPSLGSYTAHLNGYQEVPPIYTTGKGDLELRISGDGQSISYKLIYSSLSSHVTQAHIHFGERPVNGGIIAYLCDNTKKSPQGTPACPDSGAVSGTLTAGDVDPGGDPEPVTKQGIAPGDFAGLVAAIESGDAYANVHTVDYPSGEIRGWLEPGP